jgi:hypothetical protein
VLWPGERRLQRVRISQAGKATVLPYLIGMDRVDDDPADPARCSPPF